MIAAAFGIFGLVVGSFLNVVVLRRGSSKSWSSGRSGCMSCGYTLAWFDLVPVASWVALAGRCRKCRARISLQYPLVEAAAGTAFALVGGASLPLLALPLALACACLLICIFVCDLRTMTIPDAWAWPLALLALAYAFASSDHSQPALLLALAGPLAALPLFALWLGSRGAWMGLGDPKLALGVGWLLGWPLGIFGIMFAFIIGAMISVIVLLPLPMWARLLARLRAAPIPTDSSPQEADSYTMKSEVPFGPFLIASCFLLWFAALYGVAMPLI